MSNPHDYAYYRQLESRLRALEGSVEAVAPGALEWYREYLDVGEYGLAVEVMAEELHPDIAVDTVDVLASALLREAVMMGLGDDVVARLRDVATR